MAKHNIVFKHDKETNKKQRFVGDMNAPINGTIYIDKAIAGDTKEITVEVTLPDVAPVAAQAAS